MLFCDDDDAWVGGWGLAQVEVQQKMSGDAQEVHDRDYCGACKRGSQSACRQGWTKRMNLTRSYLDQEGADYNNLDAQIDL